MAPRTWSPEYRREFRKQLKLKAFSVLGNICCKCGVSDIRCLQLDHIYGGGTKERIISNINGKVINTKADRTVCYYRWILKNPVLAKEKFQLLCANCNWIKRYE